jgi:hypothetical protein
LCPESPNSFFWLPLIQQEDKRPAAAEEAVFETRPEADYFLLLLLLFATLFAGTIT